jgi:PAS domain S-box-containing protein
VIVNREFSQRDAINTQLRLLTKAVESSHSAITIADATQPDLPLVYVNPAFEQITGYMEHEILGKNCRFLQGEDRDQPAINVIHNALRERKACVVVLRNYRKDGTMFWNELRLTPMQDDFGTTSHFVGVATDITDRKIAEQRIRSQNEVLIRTNHALDEARKLAEEATRLKSEFLATMSHELLTPLHTIIGYTDIQLAGMAGDVSDEQHKYLERVLIRAEHLLGLINDILDLSKIEAGRIEIVHKPFAPKELLSSILEQITQLVDTKQLQIEYAIDETLPDIIIGDVERLKQIAIHLLSNSVKFTDSGSIKLEFHRQELDTWTLSVIDSGIGIPAHLQETIFDEFRQVDSSWRRQYGGTGLGLAIVRKLVLLMGGNIRVHSELHSGSTFTVLLPLKL